MKIAVDLFNQHSGNLRELKRLAMDAYCAGADIVKIQILNSERIWGDNTRKYLEMTYDEVKEIKDYCDTIGVEFSATVFDEKGLEWIDDLGVNFYKIASVTAAKEKELTEKILSRNKETIISTGMFEPGVFPYGTDSNIKYLYCISKYPTMLHDEKVRKMPKSFPGSGYFGLSDHCVGTGAALVAKVRGAQFLEKHFTSNVNIQNQFEKAHLCSFDATTLRKFKNDVNEIDIVLGNK
jgi:pseudaminic acid synthase